jgi:hypothetical protein
MHSRQIGACESDAQRLGACSPHEGAVPVPGSVLRRYHVCLSVHGRYAVIEEKADSGCLPERCGAQQQLVFVDFAGQEAFGERRTLVWLVELGREHPDAALELSSQARRDLYRGMATTDDQDIEPSRDVSGR